MKLCIDCKYHSLSKNGADDRHLCTKHRKETIDLVTGKTYVSGIVSCYNTRAVGISPKVCGVEGKYWEAKE